MITRVYIDNFRCFSNFEVKPDRVNLLIGGNGAGKSTFCRCTAQCRKSGNRSLVRRRLVHREYAHSLGLKT
ncbi:MAG: AAA family ATPase [Blastocatellia bacterium]